MNDVPATIPRRHFDTEAAALWHRSTDCERCKTIEDARPVPHCGPGRLPTRFSAATARPSAGNFHREGFYARKRAVRRRWIFQTRLHDLRGADAADPGTRPFAHEANSVFANRCAPTITRSSRPWPNMVPWRRCACAILSAGRWCCRRRSSSASRRSSRCLRYGREPTKRRHGRLLRRRQRRAVCVGDVEPRGGRALRGCPRPAVRSRHPGAGAAVTWRGDRGRHGGTATMVNGAATAALRSGDGAPRGGTGRAAAGQARRTPRGRVQRTTGDQ